MSNVQRHPLMYGTKLLIVSRVALLILLFTATVFVAPAKAGEAAGSIGLTISPTIIDDLSGKPGDTLTTSISVGTTSTGKTELIFEHFDLGFAEGTYEPLLFSDDAPDPPPFTTRGWFSVPQDRFTIQGGASKTVELTIDIPDNATSGVHLGAALFRTVPDTATGGSQVRAAAQSGPLLFITVDGGAEPKAKLAKFEIPKTVTASPITPDLIIENVGDSYFSFRGSVSLSGRGRTFTEPIATEQSKYVIQDQPRELEGEDGSNISLGSKNLPPGKYTVKVDLRIDPTGQKLRESRTVWIIPWWLRTLVGLGIAVFLASLLSLYIWWKNRRDRNRAWQSAAQMAAGESPEDSDG